MRLKVISLNIWHGQVIDVATDFLKAEQADVVLLQEVTSGMPVELNEGISNTLEVLQQRFPNHYLVYAPVWLLKDFGISQGQAILSKYPIETFTGNFYAGHLSNMSSSFKGEIHGGLALTAQIKKDQRTIRLMSIHFPWSLYPDISQFQLDAVSKLTEQIESETEIIVGGDFNVTDDSPVYTQLSQVLTDDRPAGLHNTLHPTLHKLKGTKQIAVDYLFHRGEKITKLNSHVPDVSVSDHLPVVVEYQLD